MTRRLAPFIHRAEVLGDPGHYFPACDCGWTGDQQPTATMAWQAARAHERTPMTPRSLR